MAGPGADLRTISGTAALAWEVLGEPGGRADVGPRITERWPAAAPVDLAQVDEALAVLVESGIAEPVGAP